MLFGVGIRDAPKSESDDKLSVMPVRSPRTGRWRPFGRTELSLGPSGPICYVAVNRAESGQERAPLDRSLWEVLNIRA
jgi:hypothetical protein